jgi:carbohydrate-selective porin OprB
MHLFGGVYLQPTVTHVPNPGANRRLAPATAVTMLVTVLF